MATVGSTYGASRPPPSTRARRGVFRLFLLFLLALLPLLAHPGGVRAQEGVTVDLHGQVRPRAEGRTPVDGDWDSFASMRVRAALEARLRQGTRIFIQLQDVRFFGEESSTLGDFSADNFDLHQGYLEMDLVPDVGGRLRVGRQELALGEQRLVGAVNWTQQGRSFDGARFTAGAEAFSVDLFGMKLSEGSAPQRTHDAHFLGLWTNMTGSRTGSVDVFALLIRDSRDEATEDRTFGARWLKETGPVSLRAEGSYQLRDRGTGKEGSAWMFALRAGTGIPGDGTLTLWYDHLSGDDDLDDGKPEVFNTLFATNHAFYGLADYFLDIPAHTGGLGLRDAAVKLTFTPWPRTTLAVDLHHFRTAQEGGLSTTALGNEVDLTLSRALAPGLALTTGYSFFRVEDGMRELGRLTEDAHWLYLMLDAAF